MKNNTMNRGARQLLALLLSVAMLVSVFSATGLSLVFAAGENYASVSFGDGYMIATNLQNPEDADGSADGHSTYYFDAGGTNGTKGHTFLGTAVGMTGEYADRYALKMDSGNDRLMMQIPAGTFTAGSTVTITATYYFPESGAYDARNILKIRNGTDNQDLKQVEAMSNKGTVKTMVLDAPLAAENVNGKEFWVTYADSGHAVPEGAYLLDVTFATASTTDPEPETPSDTTAAYAAVAIADGTFVNTGLNSVGHHNSGPDVDGFENRTVSAESLGLTGDYADAYAVKMDTNNDRLTMVVPEGTFAAGSTVTATLTYYFPEGIDNANLSFGEWAGSAMAATAQTVYAKDNAGAVKTLTLTLSPEEVNGKTFWAKYAGDDNEDSGFAYVLKVAFSVGENTFYTLSVNEAENGKARVVQAGNSAVAIAVPNAGYVLEGWYNAENALIGEDYTYWYLPLTGDVTLTPRFAKDGGYAAVAIGDDFMVTTGMLSPEASGTGGWETFYHNANTDGGVNGITGFTVTCPEIGLTDAAYAEDYALKFIGDNDRLIMKVADGTFADNETVTVKMVAYFPAGTYNANTRLTLGERTAEGMAATSQSAYALNNEGTVQTITFELPAADVNGKTFWAIYYGDAGDNANAYLLDVSFSAGNNTFATLTPETVTGGDTHVVQAGNNVGVIAVPDVGYEFASWHAADGSQLSTSNPYLYTLTGDSTIAPHFTGFALTFNTPTDENGANADETKYGTASATSEAGTAIATATPKSGITFVGWYDAANTTLLSTENPYTFPLTADTTLTPRFQITATATELEDAVDNAITWLVGYTPESRDAYKAAVLEARALLEGTTATADDLAAALSKLQAAAAALTWANSTTDGYAAVDFRDGTAKTYNAYYATGGNNADQIVNESFADSLHGMVLSYQNQNITMNTNAGVFSPTDYVKLTVYYYYTSTNEADLQVVPSNERLGVDIAGSHDFTFRAGGEGLNSTETWQYEQESTLTVYIDDVSALADSGWATTLIRWLNSDEGSTGGERKLHIEAIELEAVEIPNKITVTGNASPSESGAVEGTGDLQQGSTRSFTAVPNRGYKFVNWTADQVLTYANGTDANSQTIWVVLPATETLALTANFEALTPFTVTAQANDASFGKTEGSGDYYENEAITLKATPNDGYMFLKWTNANGDTVSTEATYTIPAGELTAAATYTANFVAIISAPMVFTDLTNAAINNASHQLELTAGAGATASVVIETDTKADGEQVLISGAQTLKLAYYLEPYTKGATASTDETITVTWKDADGETQTYTILAAGTGRDTSTDGVTQEAADSKLTTATVELPANFDPAADTLTLTYSNGTVLHLTEARLTSANESWRYLDFAPEADTITLPITILDYMPNGMVFEANMNEYPYNAFNLSPSYVAGYANENNLTFSGALVEDTLYNGHTVYKPIVLQYLVDTILAPSDDHEFYSNLIGNLNNGNGFTVSGTQEGMDDWMALVERIREIRAAGTIGSWETTLQKLGNQNGARMYLNHVEGDATPYVETLYDVAYYMLNTLFVSDDDYNEVVPELNTLKLQAVGNGYYVFDSGYDTVYNTTTGVIENTGVISPNHTARLEGSTDAAEVANQFFPLDDGLGYEDRVDMAGIADRNFGFSMQGHGLFVYRADEHQEFLFTGDDDVHLFINGVNVLSMDGLHGREFRQVSLNDIATKAGLVDGNVYSFDFFFMERHTTRSNMKLYTNIEILPPDMDVEKNAYQDAAYSVDYNKEDTCAPFTKLYYEFVLHNEDDSQYTLENLQFVDELLGVELNATHAHLELNDVTKVTDLVFILEHTNGTKTTYTYNAAQTADEYEAELLGVLKSGLKPGEVLRVRGIQHVLIKDLENIVNVVAEYTDANSVKKTAAGSATQAMTIVPGDYTVTVDYGVPLYVSDVEAFGSFERVMQFEESNMTMVNTISLKDGNGVGAYGTLAHTANGLQYTPNKEMLGEDTFTLLIESKLLRVGENTVYPASEAALSSSVTGATLPNYNAGEGCIQNMHNEGARADFTVKTFTKLALLTIVYSNGNTTSSKMSLHVAGQFVGDIDLPATGSWSTFKELTLLIETPADFESVIKVSLLGNGFGFNVRELQVVATEESTTTNSYEKNVTFVPANNIYYENEFVTDNDMMTAQTGAWALDGTTANKSIYYSSQTYGQGGNTGFNSSVTYSNGSALKGTGNGMNTKLSFTFTGTGVDIYSRTNQETGEIRVLLWQQAGDTETLKKARYVDCEFYSGNIYQVPVVSFTDLDYGTYRVEVFVYPAGNAFTGNRCTFYFDGIRVYNPLGSGAISPNGYNVYLEENELGATFINLRDTLLGKSNAAGLDGWVQGALFYDYKTDAEGNKLDGNVCEFADYETYGPKNEVYLAPGQSIAFEITGDYTGIQVAAKSANGTSGTMVVDGTEYTVSSTMDMYYRLNKDDAVYTITNKATNGEGFILSLTKLKLTNSNAVFSISEADMALASVVITEDTIAYANAYLNGDTETAAALADKMAANAAPTVPATGSESVKFEAALPQQHVEIVVESALGSYTVTEEAVISEIDVAAAELARQTLINNLLKAN